MEKMHVDNDQASLRSGKSSSDRNLPPGAGDDFATIVSETFVKEPGVVEASQDGFYGPNKSHILTYNEGKLRPWLAPILSPELTVFNTFHKWFRHLRNLSLAIILTLILGYNSTVFPDSAMGDPVCVESDPEQNRNICELEGLLGSSVDSFQWLVAFVLSGYVTLSVNTWALRRGNYASLCGASRNLNILLSSLIPIDPDNKQLCETRKTLARWVTLALELAMLKARGHMDSDEGRDYLLSTGLLEDGEWESMVKGDRHSTVFWWIMVRIQQLQKEGYVCVEYVVRLSSAVSEMRGQANDMMSCLDRDKPVPYVAMCALLVQCNVLLFSLWKTVKWAIWLRAQGGPELFSSSQMWIDMIILFFWNMSYVALYDIGYVLQNPFQDRRIDIPHELVFGGVQRLSTTLAEGNASLPPSMKQKKLL